MPDALAVLFVVFLSIPAFFALIYLFYVAITGSAK